MIYNLLVNNVSLGLDILGAAATLVYIVGLLIQGGFIGGRSDAESMPFLWGGMAEKRSLVDQHVARRVAA